MRKLLLIVAGGIASLGLIALGFIVGQRWQLPEERLAARMIRTRAAYDRCRAEVSSRSARSEEDLDRLKAELRIGIRRPEDLSDAEALAYDLDRGAMRWNEVDDEGQALVRAEWPHFLAPTRERCAKEYEAFEIARTAASFAARRSR